MNAGVQEAHIVLDGLSYAVTAHRRVVLPPDAPRLAVVSYLPNRSALDLLMLCLRSLRDVTGSAAEIWVVDNNSPVSGCEALLAMPDVNLALNRTEPIPPGERHDTRYLARVHGRWGSYANAVALELAVRLVDPATRVFGTLHMDCLVCHPLWLETLCSRLDAVTKAVGVRMDRSRTPDGVIHVLGMVVDFQVFRSLGLSFFPRLPAYDTGDLVTVKLREAGFSVYAYPNSLWDADVAAGLPGDSPFKGLDVDRTVNDNGEVIFMHLGRGIQKAVGAHTRGVPPGEWIRFCEQFLAHPEAKLHALPG